MSDGNPVLNSKVFYFPGIQSVWDKLERASSENMLQ